MTMNEIWNRLTEQFATYMPNLLAGLAVLLGGWIIALLLSALVRKVLSRTKIGTKLASWMPVSESTKVPIEKWGASVVFWLIMLLVLIAFFQTLRLTNVTEPLQDLLGAFVAYVPRLVAGSVLIVIAWLIATVIRKLVGVGLAAVKFDERLGGSAEKERAPAKGFAGSIADSVYWIILLIFLPAVLGALEMNALLDPVNEMMSEFLAFLPNLIAAAITLIVGWFIARIVQRSVAGILASGGADQLAERWGFGRALGERRMSDVVGLLLYFVILVPVLIAALNQLQLDAITDPASQMLETVLVKLPQVIAAVLILLLAFLIGRVVRGLVENILAGLGFNQVLVRLGLSKNAPEGSYTPSTIVGVLLIVGVMLLATIAAAQTLEYAAIADIVRQFLRFAGQVLLGVLLFGLGLMLAQIVFDALRTSDSPRAHVLAWVGRVAIIILVGAMALRATGVADSIVNLAFGALVCGLAAAGAIAFGLGGRDFASNQLAKWKKHTEGGDDKA